MKSLLCCIILSFFSSPLIAQIDFSEKNYIKNSLLSEMDTKVIDGKYENITSILIAQNGKLIFEKYYNNTSEATQHNVRSGTKTIATFLTGLAIDKGFITSEKDKIFPYLKHKKPVKNPDPRKEHITIEDLLTMSSMLEADDGNYLSRGHEERMYYIEDWTQFFIDLPIRSYPFNPPPSEQPYGRFFHYASAQAAAVSEIVETAIGKKADVFLKENLFDPLEISEYKLHYTPSGYLNTAGGSEYRSRDFLKLVQLCLQKGTWNNKQVLSKTWIEKATSPKANAREGVDYGYFLWINPFGNETKYDAYYMAGNGGNKMVVIPALNATVVITTTNYNNRNAHNYTDELLNSYIVPALEK
ncbi:serine hydrolase domain-containing protein [Cochleicola gelatinilyticus]|uniref:Beta-lactamase-related domain-containing protein n=1 Tax=Cochleicola gelatinilyticus TaxID=1763537 RepID=A0A167J8B6_9FLAO|nr:serine hydrolase [Cochleicola gelatinilyticus]OAB80423.1 hypothetical protein ULVI_06720 [Cochleicola gelatinilyticus]